MPEIVEIYLWICIGCHLTDEEAKTRKRLSRLLKDCAVELVGQGGGSVVVSKYWLVAEQN